MTDERPNKPVLRTVVSSDVSAVMQFLSQQLGRLTPAQWSPLFHYPWMAEKPDLGYLIEVGGELKGFIGIVYALRQVRGELRLVGNLSSWVIDDDLRGMGIGTSLMQAALQRMNCTFTLLTPTPISAALCARLGFRSIGARKFLLPPLTGAATLLAATGAKVVTKPERMRPNLTAVERLIVDDHGESCRYLLLEGNGERLFVVTRRRIKYHLPLCEILHVSSKSLFQKHLELVKLVAISQNRAVSLSVDERFLLRPPRIAYTVSHPVLYKSDVLAPDDIDNLYSEYVLLDVYGRASA